MSTGKFQQLLESYGMLTTQQRLFYPRNFNLSPEFIASLKKEMARQSKTGIEPELFARKLNKALQFYIADYKKLQAAKKVDKVTTALK
jgi:hypothetical protein